MNLTGFPLDAEAITARINSIVEREGLTDYTLAAGVDLDRDEDWYGVIRINEKVRFLTENYIRQSDLLDELDKVPGLIVTAHEGPKVWRPH